ncbi:MAG: peptidylprolyl isomerase, partial [Planctomycetota bacterium]
VIQAGDPTGTGSGGSTLGDFDDQFHVDLQHNRTGLLSMAKTTDDTNDSQFFVTEGPSRHLDFNHTIFGLLVEGESVRDEISNVPVVSGRPTTDVVIQDAEVFIDEQNGVLQLSAPEGTTGSTTVTVSVSDNKGGLSTRTFNVTILPDPENGQPFLDDIPVITTTIDTPVTHQLTAQDVEGDSIVFLDQATIDSINDSLLPESQIRIPVRSPASLDYTVDPSTGLLTVTPSAGLSGTQRITVAVASSTNLNINSPIDFQVVEIDIQ